jgi:HD-like signal output (HDOD) protein
MLHLANSVYHGGGRDAVRNVKTAVVKLGLRQVRELIYSITLTKVFVDTSVINPHHFWRHSLGVGVFAREIAAYIGLSYSEQELVFLGGLMHDIGVMVFCYLIPDSYIDFLQHVSKEEANLDKQELDAFAIEHAELGALFMKKWWKVEDEILHGVRYHHQPFCDDEALRRVAEVVHCSNGICNNHGYSNGAGALSEVFKEGAWLHLGLTLDDAENMIEEVARSLDEAEMLMQG